MPRLLGSSAIETSTLAREREDPMKEQSAVLESTLTCPECGHVETETMPTDACQWFYECKSCKTLLRPREGDCCVYCSYGSIPCPPIQLGQSCCQTKPA